MKVKVKCFAILGACVPQDLVYCCCFKVIHTKFRIKVEVVFTHFHVLVKP